MGIEKQVDDFLNQISEAGLLFKTSVDIYLKGKKDAFLKKAGEIAEIEHRGDSLRRLILTTPRLKNSSKICIKSFILSHFIA